MARSRRLSLSCVGIAISIVGLLQADVHALNPTTGVDQYAFQSWTYRNGLPSSTIYAVAQDANGYLWLGTSLGLVRFDGTQFVQTNFGTRTRHRESSVRAVVVGRDESIWVGFRAHGIARIRHGTVTLYDSKDGAPSGSTTSLYEDAQGAIWAGGARGLAVFRKDHWQAVQMPGGDNEITELFEDGRGRMWVATPRQLLVQTSNFSGFVPVAAPQGISAIVEDLAGHIWVGSQALLTRIQAESESRVTTEATTVRLLTSPVVAARVTSALRDADGNLWLATAGGGLFRVTDPSRSATPAVERVKENSGLTSGAILALLEDKDRDLWVATNHGLNRLADTSVLSIDGLEPQTSVNALLAHSDGTVWAGTNEGVDHLTAQGMRERFSNARLGLRSVRAVHRDRDDTLWIASDTAVTRVVRDTVRPVPLPRTFVRILSVVTDADDGLWIADEELGVYRWAANTLVAMPMPPGASGAAVALADTNGDVWIGFHDGGVARYRHGQIEHYFENQTLVGVMTLFEDSGRRVWFGTSSGVALFRNGEVRAVPSSERIPLRYVTSITQDAEGYLWIGTSTGLLRIHPEELEKAAADPKHQPIFRVVDSWDGLPGSPAARGYPTSTPGPNGTVWFTVANGIVAVNPHRLKPRRVSPSVQIEQLSVDGRPFELDREGAVLPPRPRIVQLAYTAVNFNGPTKLRFRYRLDGYDQDWNRGDAGQPARYTNLPPGRYRFQVAVSVPGDVHERQATRTFTVQPDIFQTSAFYLIVAAAIGALTGTAWLLRSRQINLRFAAVLSERTRVAREIHDTTLQNLGAIALQFDNLGSQAEAVPGLKSEIDMTRRHVEDCIRETRQAIWDLRSPLRMELDLPAMMREHAKALIAGRDIDFDLVVAGTPPALSEDKKEQLARIAQEALTNAVRHSHATRIRAELNYEDGVTLSIVDDGTGFALDETAGGRDAAHWGLVGMYERAARIGARLLVKSAPRLGTEVRVFVP
jgi:ligand-binding sensor domain-containing protein/signal transduction histidine kinase